MTSKKASQIFAAAGFLIVLLSAMAATLLRPKENYSYYENRAYAEMPALTAESAAAGSWGEETESCLRDHAAGRATLLRLNTWIDLYLARRPVVNQTVVLDGLLLPWNDYETVDPAAVERQAGTMAQNLSGVAALVESYGGRYLYVEAPCQNAYFGSRYPWYLNSRAEYFGTAVPALNRALDAAGVDYVDMGEKFAALGDPAELSSRVDNHYSLAGAYLTYREIVDRFNADAGGTLPVLEDGNFQFSELPNRYLGSRLRKLLGLWPVEEHLSIAVPDAPVAFTRSDDGAPNAPVVYSMPAADGDVLYSLYMGGDVRETVIDTGRPGLPTLLVYGDSFTNAAETLLYYSFGEMRSLDLRQYSAMSLGDYIRTYRPDYVVCIRDYEALLLAEGNGTGVD